jgi:hypothetical protein
MNITNNTKDSQKLTQLIIVGYTNLLVLYDFTWYSGFNGAEIG